MGIFNILNAPWAIVPEKLVEVGEIYLGHLRGEVERPPEGQPRRGSRGPEVRDGVARLPVQGIVVKRPTILGLFFAETVTRQLAADLKAALSDPQVHSIVLDVDSPGGTVDGVEALASLIYEARGKKPIAALADGMMASAAYWIGSAADKVYITGDTTAVGSIGVVATHVDYSKAEERRGIKVTEITAGKYKRIASEHAPLTEVGRASIQEQVDHVYRVFVDAVARNRKTDSETVLGDMAEGRLFLGKHAIAAGLVDGVSTLDALVDQLNQQHRDGANSASQAVAPKKPVVTAVPVRGAPAKRASSAVSRPRPAAPTKPAVAPSEGSVSAEVSRALRAHADWADFSFVGTGAGLLAELRKPATAGQYWPHSGEQMCLIMQVLKPELEAKGWLVRVNADRQQLTVMREAAAAQERQRALERRLYIRFRYEPATRAKFKNDFTRFAAFERGQADPNLSAEEKKRLRWSGDPELQRRFSFDFNAWNAYEAAMADPNTPLEAKARMRWMRDPEVQEKYQTVEQFIQAERSWAALSQDERLQVRWATEPGLAQSFNFDFNNFVAYEKLMGDPKVPAEQKWERQWARLSNEDRRRFGSDFGEFTLYQRALAGQDLAE
ncbi:MAG TPA: signal peptide peptidase SppA [Terriglobales bacterium]|nr:signal peptide peptidase SppA [Terriglobales bacterium]